MSKEKEAFKKAIIKYLKKKGINEKVFNVELISKAIIEILDLEISKLPYYARKHNILKN